MTCPDCGYIREAFELECPKCAHSRSRPQPVLVAAAAPSPTTAPSPDQGLQIIVPPSRPQETDGVDTSLWGQWPVRNGLALVVGCIVGFPVWWQLMPLHLATRKGSEITTPDKIWLSGIVVFALGCGIGILVFLVGLGMWVFKGLKYRREAASKAGAIGEMDTIHRT